jgi:preprotein translocase subunit SecB
MQDSESPEMTGDAGAAEPVQKRVDIQKIYVKDVSYEAPGTPQIFTAEWVPQVSQELANSHTQLGEFVHEVCLRVTITVKIADKVAYLVEVNQAGIFNLVGHSPDAIERLIAVYCPSMLFPYAREVVSSMSARGGFPALVLQHVDFATMYQQYLHQKTAQAQAELDNGAASH